MKLKLIILILAQIFICKIPYAQNQSSLINSIAAVFNTLNEVKKNVYFIEDYKSEPINEVYKNSKSLERVMTIINADSMSLVDINVNLLKPIIGNDLFVPTEGQVINFPIHDTLIDSPFKKQYDSKITNFYKNEYKYTEPDTILEAVSDELQNSTLTTYSKIQANQMRKKTFKLLSIYEGKRYFLIVYKMRIIPSVDEHFIMSELILK